MSEETTTQRMPEQFSDILLVLDKEKKKIQAVKSIDDNGNMETVDPTKKNQNQFMRVDKHGDFFSNFFSNFFSQLKNPSNFSFFKVPAPVAVEKAQEMQKQINNPTPEGEKVMKDQELKPELNQDKKQENQDNMETTQTTPVTLLTLSIDFNVSPANFWSSHLVLERLLKSINSLLCCNCICQYFFTLKSLFLR